MPWYYILAIIVGALAVTVILSSVFYRLFFKRLYDLVLSFIALVILSPLLIVLTVVGAVVMKGNPFFTQERPGKIDKKTGKEKIFKLIKFRTMTCEKYENGNYLPDEKRLTKYGQFLRKTSIDELPELICIFIGEMSVIGPRPLLVKYLGLYNERQHHRHDVRPGLTGYAQCHGRNAVNWADRFEMDVRYAESYSFFGDIKILFDTVFAVLKREGISSSSSATMEEFTGNGTYKE